MPALAPFLVGGLKIVLIDLTLGGDNALVIAMAVRALPAKQRRIAIMTGAAAAVILRVAATFVAAQILTIEFLKLIGGALVAWLAVKVLADAGSEPDEVAASGNLLRAIWMIVFADITMSIDNILAVAGAARGSWGLIIFGLLLSIPFVVFASTMIATLMDRYPIIVYLGAAILGQVGGEMMLTDPFITRTLHPAEWAIWTAEVVLIAGIIILGRRLCRKKPSAKPPSANVG